MTARLFFFVWLCVATGLMLCGCADHYALGVEYARTLDERRQSAVTVKANLIYDRPSAR